MSSESTHSMPDEEVERLAGRLDSLLGYLLERAEPEVAVAVAELIEGLERMHAEGVRRLVEHLPGDAERLGAALRDPAISALLEMYDMSVTPPGTDALDPGGTSPTGDVSVVAPERLVQLRRRFSATTEDPEREAAGVPSRVAEVPLSEVRKSGLHGLEADGVAVLVVRHGGRIFAFRNVCPDTPFPLHTARLEGDAIVCPWHGCRFDLTSGAREEGPGPGLELLPVEVEADVIRVALP